MADKRADQPQTACVCEQTVMWNEMTRDALGVAAQNQALVLIPTGSIEQHAAHLPVETDALLAGAIAREAAQRMTIPVVVAPTISHGFTPHHLSFPGTLSLRLETYLALLNDIAKSVIEAGFPRAVFINGHGGNAAPLRSLCGQLITDGYAVGMVDYFAPGMADASRLLKGRFKSVGHACELETALMMACLTSGALCPPERQTSSDKGSMGPGSFSEGPVDERPAGERRVSEGSKRAAEIAKAVRNLPPRLTQPWIAPGQDADPITDAGAGWAAIFQADDCGYYGDPAAATCETGEALLETLARHLALFLERFAKTPLRIGIARDPDRPLFAENHAEDQI